VLLVDGVVSGLWERRRRGKILQVRVDPFVWLSRAQRTETERQAGRIGAILGLPVEFEFDRVDPRAHL